MLVKRIFKERAHKRPASKIETGLEVQRFRFLVIMPSEAAFRRSRQSLFPNDVLDLAVVTRTLSVPSGEMLRREPLIWFAAPDFQPEPGVRLPRCVQWLLRL